MEKNYTVAVITVSDRCHSGEREDLSGKKLIETLESDDFKCEFYTIVPDEIDDICKAILVATDEKHIDLVLTTGGTGFNQRDVTPDATKKVIKKEADAISYAILFNALQKTSRAMLSRGISGLRDKSIIVNLPGSPKAVVEDVLYIMPAIKHGIDVLNDRVKDCGKK